MPKSQAVAILPLQRKRPSGESTESTTGSNSVPKEMSKAEQLFDKVKEQKEALDREVASALAKAQEGRQPSPANHRTLKFYPQPADDRSARLVDVIEHGYEVLIVRREPSPTPKCPADMLQTPRSNHSGELLIPVAASPVSGEKEATPVSDASL